MVAARRGTSRLGCLVGGLVVVTALYFGFNIGEVYLRFYRFRDAMGQEARFGQGRNDLAIRTRLKLVVDSLGLRLRIVQPSGLRRTALFGNVPPIVDSTAPPADACCWRSIAIPRPRSARC